MKNKKITAIIATLMIAALSVGLSACTDEKDNNTEYAGKTVTGRIVSVENGTLTLETFEAQSAMNIVPSDEQRFGAPGSGFPSFDQVPEEGESAGDMTFGDGAEKPNDEEQNQNDANEMTPENGFDNGQNGNMPDGGQRPDGGNGQFGNPNGMTPPNNGQIPDNGFNNGQQGMPFGGQEPNGGRGQFGNQNGMTPPDNGQTPEGGFGNGQQGMPFGDSGRDGKMFGENGSSQNTIEIDLGDYNIETLSAGQIVEITFDENGAVIDVRVTDNMPPEPETNENSSAFDPTRDADKNELINSETETKRKRSEQCVGPFLYQKNEIQMSRKYFSTARRPSTADVIMPPE